MVSGGRFARKENQFVGEFRDYIVSPWKVSGHQIKTRSFHESLPGYGECGVYRIKDAARALRDLRMITSPLATQFLFPIALL